MTYYEVYRNEFEKWAIEQNYSIAKDGYGDYEHIYRYWLGWKACQALNDARTVKPEAQAEIVAIMARAMTDGLNIEGWRNLFCPNIRAHEALRAILIKYRLVEI